MIQQTACLHPFDADRYVISTAGGHNLLVNAATASLFTVLAEAQTLESANITFNARFACDLSHKMFLQLVQKKFGGYGILQDDDAVIKQPSAPDNLRLNVQLLNPTISALLAKPFYLLYTPFIFWPILILALIAPFLTYSNYFRFHPATNSLMTHGWVVIVLVYVSVLVHEIGHVAACRRFRLKHGSIGFGFYLFIFPVFYADISSLWQTNRQQRVIANLGGIFAELLFANILLFIFYSFNALPCLTAAYFVVLTAIIQLIPFMQRDGYWVLVDLTNTPNLLGKSTKSVKKFLSKEGMIELYKQEKNKKFCKDVVVLLYGIINISGVFLFAWYMIASHGNQLIRFPSAIVQAIQAVGTPSFYEKLAQISILAFSFYIISLNYIIKMILKKRVTSTLKSAE